MSGAKCVRYHKVSWHKTNPDALFARTKDLRGVSERSVESGRPITDWDPLVSFCAEGEDSEDCLDNVVSWLIVSDKLKRLIEDAGLAGATFHPLRVTHESGKRLGRYWYMNALAMEGALDVGRSDCYRTDADGLLEQPILVVQKYVLDPTGIGDRDIFRLSESTRPVFVSERFRNAFKEHGCTGMEFKEVPAGQDLAPRERSMYRGSRKAGTPAKASDVPPDLAEALATAYQFNYDLDACECGEVELRSLEKLRTDKLPVISRGTEHEDRDPKGKDRTGYYSVKVVDLLAGCEACPPRGLLAWLPETGVFGTWDCDHLQLTVFPGATWSDICDNPARYLSAQWDRRIGEYAAPWEHGKWRRGKPR